MPALRSVADRAHARRVELRLIDQTYGHLAPDAEEFELGLLNAQVQLEVTDEDDRTLVELTVYDTVGVEFRLPEEK